MEDLDPTPWQPGETNSIQPIRFGRNIDKNQLSQGSYKYN